MIALQFFKKAKRNSKYTQANASISPFHHIKIKSSLLFIIHRVAFHYKFFWLGVTCSDLAEFSFLYFK